MKIHNLKASIRRLTTDEDGVTAVEYGVIGALIIVVCVLTITALGSRLDGVFGAIRDSLPAAP